MSTKVTINPGACGFTAVVVVTKKEGKTFSVSITTKCEMGKKLDAELEDISFMDVFKRLLDNPVYRKASVCLRHGACPVPSGILKALEVEAGLNVPKDVSIVFEHTDE